MPSRCLCAPAALSLSSKLVSFSFLFPFLSYFFSFVEKQKPERRKTKREKERRTNTEREEKRGETRRNKTCPTTASSHTRLKGERTSKKNKRERKMRNLDGPSHSHHRHRRLCHRCLLSSLPVAVFFLSNFPSLHTPERRGGGLSCASISASGTFPPFSFREQVRP